MSPPDPIAEGSLKSFQWQRFLRAPDAQLLEQLYTPALKRAISYDRCCAYFSSRILSVAARGFGGLIANLLDRPETAKPAVRLLINQQIDAEDLEALNNSSDLSHLGQQLLAKLETPRHYLQKNRLEMLAWLYQQGWLEIRVGVMRYTQGILHAKYGIVEDVHGNRLAFSGSDNETGAAVVDNYEELQLNPCWLDQPFVDYYQNRFETLWQNQDPQVQTLSLPQAVAQEILQLAPQEAPTESQPLELLRIKMLSQMVAAAPFLPNGASACDATAMVEMWPHQHRVVEDTAKAFPVGRLLCDEVGMGKTIEAIMILRRLLAGRGVKRALLLVPAGLLKQWQDELREKGGLMVPRYEGGQLHQANGQLLNLTADQALAQQDLLLVSREWARMKDNRVLLLDAPAWDLILLDEAHAARRQSAKEGEFNRGNLLLDLLRELQLRAQTKGLILLSATPMQIHPWEPWDLLSVLGVGGEWMVEFKDIDDYYTAIGRLQREMFGGSDSQDLAPLVEQLASADSDFPSQVTADDLVFASGSEQREWGQKLRQGSPLSRWMHRNTRDTLRYYHKIGLIKDRPPQRQVEDVVFDYQDPIERECYQQITHYIDTRFDDLEEEKKGKGFVMTIYRRRIASSPQAIKKSLHRRLEGLQTVIAKAQLTDNWWQPEEVDWRHLEEEEDLNPALPTDPVVAQQEKEEIGRLLAKLEQVDGDSKYNQFYHTLQQIRADGRAALVFTEYTDTMDYLRDRLEGLFQSELGCYSGRGGEIFQDGGWETVTKGEITQALFQGQLKILLCTDAASEGLNLQAASALINYDLPWNPSKVEQRIGRIDRIGQRLSSLPIRNLFLDESVDMVVYQTLRHRCRLFEHFVGRMQPVLSLAQQAMRSNRHDLDQIARELEAEAKKIEADDLLDATYQVNTSPQNTRGSSPLLDRANLQEWMQQLSQQQTTVPIQQLSDETFSVQLEGKEHLLSTNSKALDQDLNLIPFTANSEIIQQISQQLQTQAPLPLVTARYQTGSVCVARAYWLEGKQTTPITSFQQMRSLLQDWGGDLPSRKDYHNLFQQAMSEAETEAIQIAGQIEQAWKDSLQQQLLSAQMRLKRELGRVLRCSADDVPLEQLLTLQIGKESSRGQKRYSRAKQLLGGNPHWTPQEAQEIQLFVDSLNNKKRNDRLSGNEMMAAINDPRWILTAGR